MANQHTSRGVRTKGTSEWFWVNNVLVDDYGPIIGAYGIAVYTVLARFASHSDQSCYPSYQTIAKRLRLSRRKVVQGVCQLEACGLIRREPRMDDAGDAQSNRYTLLSVEPSTRDEVGHAEHQVVHTLHHPVHAVHQDSASGAPGVVHMVHPNKTYREPDLEKEYSVPPSTDGMRASGRDANLTSTSPGSERPHHRPATHATSAVPPGEDAIHLSAPVDEQCDPLDFDAHGRRDEEAFARGGDPKRRKCRSTQVTRASPVPEIFPITETMRAWAQEHVSGVHVERETEQFLDHHRAKGTVFKDWLAAWRLWMRKAASFQQQRATSRAWSSQADMNSARQNALVL
jgi:DNA-binding MarR family transcriptional regulator